MAFWHLKSHRKPTGALLSVRRKKRRSDRGSKFLETGLAEKRLKIRRTKGGNTKLKLLSGNMMNLRDSSGKIVKTKILTVTSNTANPNYVRRNIITKGAIVKTDLGEARITSKPSQDGVINGILVKEAKK